MVTFDIGGKSLTVIVRRLSSAIKWRGGKKEKKKENVRKKKEKKWKL